MIRTWPTRADAIVSVGVVGPPGPAGVGSSTSTAGGAKREAW